MLDGYYSRYVSNNVPLASIIFIIGITLEILVMSLVSIPFWSFVAVLLLFSQMLIFIFNYDRTIEATTFAFSLSILGTLLILWCFHAPGSGLGWNDFYIVQPSIIFEPGDDTDKWFHQTFPVIFQLWTAIKILFFEAINITIAVIIPRALI